MDYGFNKEFDAIMGEDGESNFTYRGEEEFTPEPTQHNDDDDNREPKQKGKKTPKGKKPPKNKKTPKPSNNKSNNKQFIIKIVVASLILSGGLLFWKFGPLSSGEGAGTEQQEGTENSDDDLPRLSETQTADNSGDDEEDPKPDSSDDGPSVVMEDEEIKPGLSDFEGGDHNTNTGEVVESGEFLKDINGSQIPKHYEVKKINYETDFVSYVKKRGVTGDGVELLWLDAEYKGNPYVIQVPFKIWKELDETGITVVDMEVLTIDKNLKVISNMQVKENYKEIMEKGEKEINRK